MNSEYIIHINEQASFNNRNRKLDELKKALRESQEKIENDKLKTEFFGNISHEFKTPLNILMGAMQLIDLYTLNGAIQDPEKKLDKYMNIMRQNSFRLLRLINNIIDLTKIDSNYFNLDLHNYDIALIVDNVIQSVSVYANAKSIILFYSKEFKGKIIACDADKIERILLNLLSNALKFTNVDGNIQVRMGIRQNMVFITVEDDGIGIPKDKQTDIFERFRQVDKSFTRNREGSGIGLSIVKALVEMHKGDIWVESEYEKGSKFIVELPDIQLEEEEADKQYSMSEGMIEERIKVELSDLET
jgi:signal transduction histidine kinase